MDLEIEHRSGHPSVAHITLDRTESVTIMRDALALARNAGSDAPVWIHGSDEWRDTAMVEAGYRTERALLQMRRSLPAEPSNLVTRAFDATDIDALIGVNNRAFAWHPEQSGLNRARVERDMAEEWFDPDGVRILELDDRIAGFCWTKIHDAPERLGEIYVIALDPSVHGQGLGKPMTLAGLEWLHDHGLQTAMLYVESDNRPAVATYESLGFDVHRIDKLWHPS